jgi:hypothetical protein
MERHFGFAVGRKDELPSAAFPDRDRNANRDGLIVALYFCSRHQAALRATDLMALNSVVRFASP